LEPLVAKFGASHIHINSGYRGSQVNAVVGGAKTSAHSNGQAVDIRISNVSTRTVAQWVTDNLDTDQVILEGWKSSQPSSGWVHISYKETGNRGTTMVASSGKAPYKKVSSFT